METGFQGLGHFGGGGLEFHTVVFEFLVEGRFSDHHVMKRGDVSNCQCTITRDAIRQHQISTLATGEQVIQLQLQRQRQVASGRSTYNRL